jgi:hypothetical protein
MIAARIESDAATIVARDREIARLNGAITYWRDATEHTLDHATEQLRAELAASRERERALREAFRKLIAEAKHFAIMDRMVRESEAALFTPDSAASPTRREGR